VSGQSWSREEVEAVVTDYFSMLQAELQRKPYNKSEHRRELRRLLNNRSDGSIERKHQNISAILIEAHFPSIPGYKPLFNYQSLLADGVLERIDEDASLQRLALMFVDGETPQAPVADILSRLSSVPSLLSAVRDALKQQRRRRYGRYRDYLAIEANNRRLGRAGEAFVVEFERAHLEALGMPGLARQVEHVSLTRGDGLGFDVRSFSAHGDERFIEVKTTQLGPATPFFVTRGELSFSEEAGNSFSLYRVFTFATDPRLFSLQGSLTASCRLEANQYVAVPR
jgi:hypothetical protein